MEITHTVDEIREKLLGLKESEEKYVEDQTYFTVAEVSCLLEQLSSLVEEATSNDKVVKEAADVITLMKSLQSERDILSSENEKLSNELGIMQEERDSLAREVSKTQAKQSATESMLRDSLALSEKEVETLKEEVETLQGEYDEYRAKVEHNTELVQSQKEELEKKDGSIHSLEEELEVETLQGEYDEYRAKVEHNTELVQSQKEELEKKDGSIHSLEEELVRVKESFGEKQEEIEKEFKQKHLNPLKMAILKEQAEKSDIQLQLSELKRSYKELEERNDKLTEEIESAQLCVLQLEEEKKQKVDEALSKQTIQLEQTRSELFEMKKAYNNLLQEKIAEFAKKWIVRSPFMMEIEEWRNSLLDELKSHISSLSGLEKEEEASASKSGEKENEPFPTEQTSNIKTLVSKSDLAETSLELPARIEELPAHQQVVVLHSYVSTLSDSLKSAQKQLSQTKKTESDLRRNATLVESLKTQLSEEEDRRKRDVLRLKGEIHALNLALQKGKGPGDARRGSGSSFGGCYRCRAFSHSHKALEENISTLNSILTVSQRHEKELGNHLHRALSELKRLKERYVSFVYGFARVCDGVKNSILSEFDEDSRKIQQWIESLKDVDQLRVLNNESISKLREWRDKYFVQIGQVAKTSMEVEKRKKERESKSGKSRVFRQATTLMAANYARDSTSSLLSLHSSASLQGSSGGSGRQRFTASTPSNVIFLELEKDLKALQRENVILVKRYNDSIESSREKEEKIHCAYTQLEKQLRYGRQMRRIVDALKVKLGAISSSASGPIIGDSEKQPVSDDIHWKAMISQPVVPTTISSGFIQSPLQKKMEESSVKKRGEVLKREESSYVSRIVEGKQENDKDRITIISPQPEELYLDKHEQEEEDGEKEESDGIVLESSIKGRKQFERMVMNTLSDVELK
ncbi:hypothetical protein ADUPG1_013230 [Aduncisulcus paluster]|uniref:Uncharacterized protein n=1 Tax=Aduncisulcus paluster TaxID=2918883 RepID=A0ABQ5K6D5_9EUKA|nr:hypothetical protein ADUPG1_013230 [Aduncisulcus paluster]